MLCAEYNVPQHPYHHTQPPPHHLHPPIYHHRPISPKSRYLENQESIFIRRSRVPYDIVHNNTNRNGGDKGGLFLLIKNDKTSPSNNWPMRQADPRRRIIQEEQQNSFLSATPSNSSIVSLSSSSTTPESKEGAGRRPSLRRGVTEMPYLVREPEEEVAERPRRHRHDHDHVHHHHHHHHHHHQNHSRSRERSPGDKHTSSSESFDEKTPRKPQQQQQPREQRPPMIRRSNTSGGSFASGLFKKKLAKDGQESRRGSVDKSAIESQSRRGSVVAEGQSRRGSVADIKNAELERPRAERRGSLRDHREVLRDRSADHKRGSRESSVNREYAKHHQKEPKDRSLHRENSTPLRREREGGSNSDTPALRRSKTQHHHHHHREEDKNRSYDRHSGEERSKPRLREEKPRERSKPREVEISEAKEKARREAAHKRKHRRNVLSEILLHEQKILEEQNLPPNRRAPHPPKFLVENPPPERAAPPPPKLVECNTCLSDDIPEDQAAKLACGHIFCNDCLVRLFNLSLTDPAHMPPRCCQPDSHIPLKHVDKLLSTKTKIKWNKKYQEFTTANRMYCPEIDCGEWIRPKDFFIVEGVKIGKCSRCKCAICGLCGLKEHGKEECPKDEDLNNVREMGKELGWQRCYNCRAMVELEKGCNHMTCRCTAEFCMICAAKWKTCSCPWFNFEPGEDDAPVPQFDENGRLEDEDLAWEDRGRQNAEDERLARQLALDFEEMDNRRERGGGGGGNLWAPLIAGAIGGLLTRTRNLEGAAMERLRRAYASAIEDDFGWGDSSDESEDERDRERARERDQGFWRIGGPHAIHL